MISRKSGICYNFSSVRFFCNSLNLGSSTDFLRVSLSIYTLKDSIENISWNEESFNSS